MEQRISGSVAFRHFPDQGVVMLLKCQVIEWVCHTTTTVLTDGTLPMHFQI